MGARRASLVFLLVVSLLAIAGCTGGGGSSATSTTDNQTGSGTSDGSEKTADANPTAMGEKATAGDWTIKVTSSARAAGAGGGTPSAGNELLVITFEVTNGGSKGQGIGPTSFTLTGEEGTTYEAAPTNDPTFIFNTQQPIGAGETREILIAYDVTPAAGPFTWVFEPFGAPSAAVLAVE